MEILQFIGQTGDYLQSAPGEPQNNNLANMARGEKLLTALRATIAQAKRTLDPARTAGVEIIDDVSTRVCDVVVLPFTGLPDTKEPLFVVMFESARGQSTNDELAKVNERLHSRNREVSQMNCELSAIDFPILILDRERRIRRFTPRARSILNVLPSDVGRPIDDIKLNIDVPDLDAQIANVILTAQMKESEVQDRDGRWYRMQIRPCEATDEHIDSAVLSLVDIDVLKHNVSDARQAEGEAEQANRAKDQFLATLSHELRTPLATVLMHAQLLRRGDADAARVKRAGEAIERGTKLQVQLIEDLLDVSRMVAGKLQMEMQPVNLTTVIRAALDAVTASAEAKTISFTVLLAEVPGTVWGDPRRLQQVIWNLLTNAIKFTPEGGRVTLMLEVADGHARFSVSDTGIGIESGFLPHVFDRFTQEDNSNTRAYGGLGLGLAIVRHIVVRHDGTVKAESAGAGRGAVFSVILPLLARPVESLDAKRPAPVLRLSEREA